MRLKTPAYPIVALTLVALSLGACASIDRRAPAAQSQADDDAYCQSAAGKQGTPAYTACLKNRDIAASRSDQRLDRTHRNMSERMLNGQ